MKADNTRVVKADWGLASVLDWAVENYGPDPKVAYSVFTIITNDNRVSLTIESVAPLIEELLLFQEAYKKATSE